MNTEEKLYAILGPDWWDKLKRGTMVSNNHDSPEQEQIEEQVSITHVNHTT